MDGRDLMTVAPGPHSEVVAAVLRAVLTRPWLIGIDFEDFRAALCSDGHEVIGARALVEQTGVADLPARACHWSELVAGRGFVLIQAVTDDDAAPLHHMAAFRAAFEHPRNGGSFAHFMVSGWDQGWTVGLIANDRVGVGE